MSTPSSPTRRAALRDKRILVVEDEALVALLIIDVLLEAGAKVVEPIALVGAAVRLAETTSADGGISAAVLDVNLGGEPAIPVSDALAERRVPFLFATGYGEGCDTGRHTEVPVLHKPYDPDQLVATLEVLVAAVR